MDKGSGFPWRHAAILLAVIALLGFFFANVEIQIEGKDGWAASLPVTFRVDKHWLLDLFWGGRPMTGYHAWVFPFVILFCHLPLVFSGRWTWRLEARALACSTLFWIIEDALWFVLNPAFGWSSLYPGNPQVWWHKHWFLGLPTDYWTFSIVGLGLLWWSFGKGTEGRRDWEKGRRGGGTEGLGTRGGGTEGLRGET